MLIQNISSPVQTTVPARPASNAGSVGVLVQPGSNTPDETAQSAGAATATPGTQSAQKPTDSQLANEVSKINKALQQFGKNIEFDFTVDKATNRQVVKLLDKATGDVVAQYPSEAVLEISQAIDDLQNGAKNGALLKQQA